jgi:pyruvate dehydrogenase E1 component beta subunit
MIQQAIQSNDPILFFEPKRRYYEKAEVDFTDPPSQLFQSRVIRQSSSAKATLVAYGPMIRTCLDAASAAQQDGIELDVIDLRALSPLDLHPVYDSVRKTGHLIVVSEAPGESSLSSEIAAKVQQECFYSLEAPVLRVTGFDTPYPPSKLEEEFLPDLDRVLHVVDRSLAW